MLRRSQVTPACLAVLTASTVTILGCGSVAEKPIDPSLTLPEIRLTKPAPGSKPNPGDPVELAGKIVVGPGAWMPGVVIVRILGDKEGRKEESSIGVELDKSDRSSGVYPFSGTLEAPAKKGRYFAQAIAMRDLGGKSGVDRILTEPIPLEVGR